MTLSLIAEHDALERALVQLEREIVRANDPRPLRLPGLAELLHVGYAVAGAMREARRGERRIQRDGAEIALEALRGDGFRLTLGEGQDVLLSPSGAIGALAPLSAVARLSDAIDAQSVALYTGTMGDPFTDITSTPQGAQAWSQVKTQLTQEGATAIDQLGAQTAFASSFDQLTGQFGVDPTVALSAATQFTMQAQTVWGAVTSIQGLIAAATNPATAPASLISSFTGIVVSIAVAAGASAGIGGAIVAAVAALLAILQSVGWLPTGPAGSTIPGCAGGVHVDPSATGFVQPIIIGCVVGVYQSIGIERVASAQNKGWRRFPEPGNAPDAGWFVADTPSTTRGPFTWGNGSWAGDGKARLVDLAWPQYHHLECEQKALLTGAPGQFQQAFWAGWKLNREMELNGQKAAADWQVLLHTLELWNRAHETGTPYTFAPKGTDTTFMPASSGCSSYGSYGPYVSYLAQDLAQNAGAGQPGTITINTGAQKAVPYTPRLVGGCTLSGTCVGGNPKTSASTTSTSTTSTSTGTKVVIGTGVAALAAGGAWLALGRPLAWSGIKAGFSRLAKKSA